MPRRKTKAMVQFGRAIRTRRLLLEAKEPGQWTQTKMAEKIGRKLGHPFSQVSYSMIENASRGASPAVRRAIQATLGIGSFCPHCGQFYFEEGEQYVSK
ncbi:MAG: helix-turn-helix transcriptional regulator [Planctomycetota bacterium]|nr:helix-turn-helix transcriptional regulator [Planctomycetota bacterium]